MKKLLNRSELALNEKLVNRSELALNKKTSQPIGDSALAQMVLRKLQKLRCG